jgi:hypothetical protein
MLLTPPYLALAAIRGVPGMNWRLRCLPLGTRLLARARNLEALGRALQTLFMPMDSTRYFEFAYVGRAACNLSFDRYLDVSSPRLVPLLLTQMRPSAAVVMINPDHTDLAESGALAGAAGLSGRIELRSCLVQEAQRDEATFDLITCVSVLEHIPDDGSALRAMLAMLKPGGTLVITVPCMARATEQYIDRNEYGLLPADADGYVFWQRYYDTRSLRERLFSIAGEPSRHEVYGELRRGTFQHNADQKRRLGAAYPYWKEPWWMANEFRRFESVDELPGEGVIGLTFVRR